MWEPIDTRTAREFNLAPKQKPEPKARPAKPTVNSSRPAADNEDAPLESDGYRALEFYDGSEVALFFDPQLRDAHVKLHKWQIAENERLATAKADSQDPFKYALRAANGSGKDAFVLAPFVIWFALCNKQSLAVVTSSSGVQLTAQTETYISRLATLVNTYFGTEVFRIRQRSIFCRLSGSQIRMFATDEAGKAEGYHPLVPGAKMALIINEAKSIDPDIISALRRCTGFTHWIYVSTPGAPTGDFYKACMSWEHTRKVDYYDCPHLSASEFEADRQDLGEHSPLFRSKWLAEFTSIGENIIIPWELINPAREIAPRCQDWPLRVGIDLAAGGDENAVQIWRGNSLVKSLYFREVFTLTTAHKIMKFLAENNISKSSEHIFADDGGIGRAIIQMMQHEGWNIRRVLNNGKANRNKEYGNKGAENWFRVKRMLELGYLSMRGVDDKCLTQLADRRFKQPQDNRVFLEPKSDAREHGRPSPDRADALVLAFSDLSVTAFQEADEIESRTVTNELRVGTPEELAERVDDMLLNYENRVKVSGQKAFGSVQVLFNNHLSNKSNYASKFRD